MANNLAQVAQIISKLLANTQKGNQRWNNSLVKNKFQTRIGDFTVEVTGGSSGLGSFSPSSSIKITKLDGVTIAEVGGYSASTALAASLSRREMLDEESQADLNRLYELISDRSEDLDELLRLL